MPEGLIVRPGARRSFISDVGQFTIAKKTCWKENGRRLELRRPRIEQIRLDLLQLERSCNRISLIPNTTQLVFQSRKAQCVDRSIINLKVIDPTEHDFAGACVFIRDCHAIESAIEGFLFAFEKARQESELLLQVALGQLRW